MSGFLKQLLVGATCALFLCVGGTLARGEATTPPTSQPTGSGSIVVTVSGENGVTSGATVKLMLLPSTSTPADPAQGAAPTGKHGKHQKKGTLITSGTTDDKGTYTFSNLADGSYTVLATLKGVGAGKAPAEVSGSTPVSVSVTLKAHKPKA